MNAQKINDSEEEDIDLNDDEQGQAIPSLQSENNEE